MAIPPDVGVKLLGEVHEAFENRKVKYWIGRGVFRQLTLHQEFGDKQGDIDVHVLREDEVRVREVVEDLLGRGFAIQHSQAGYVLQFSYKIALIKDGNRVEIQFLEREGTSRFYRAGGVGQLKFCAPEGVYSESTSVDAGTLVRVPEPAYLPAVYGPGWRDEEKTGGSPAGSPCPQ
jgi:hypothetical protein